MKAAAVSVSGIALLLAACAPGSGNYQANAARSGAWQPPANQPAPSAVNSCRSALTGEVYAIRNAQCSAGDTPVPVEPISSATPAAVTSLPAAPVVPRASCRDLALQNASKAASVDNVLKSLRGVSAKKGEFETSEAFRSRMLPVIEKAKRSAGLSANNDKLVFSFKVPEHSTQYDADAKILTIGSSVSQYIGLLSGAWASGVGNYLIAAKSGGPKSTYIASNSFGVKKEVVKVEYSNTGLALPGGSMSGWPSSFTAVRERMQPEEARAAKGSLFVVFVGQIEEPFYLSGLNYVSPTISSPIEITTKAEAIKFNPECAVLYNKSSGTVIKDILFERRW
ncbi:hypothetical protein FBY14_104176 [Azospirillum brasilense]|nr:hypothetical protein FBY14_104176 [Azospirillum brasilense]